MKGFARPATALALLCVMLATLPTYAEAEAGGLEIVAPEAVEAAGTVHYAARVSGVASRVTFLVDGERHWTDRSSRRRFERDGYLDTADLGGGSHSLTVKVKRRSGRVFHAKHVLHVAGRPATQGRGMKNSEPPAAPAPEEAAPTPALEPTPAPDEPALEPAPEPSTNLLFDGSKLSSFAQLQATPGAISETPDPLGSGETGFRFTVKDSDVYPLTPTDNPRAQALSPSVIDPGEEIWLKTKIMFPSSFPTVSGWMSLVSIYGPPFNGSSPWQIGTSNNELRWQRNGSSNYDVPWRMPLVRGRWIDVLLHERFSSSGWVEMWIDGERVTFFQSGGYNPSRVAPTERLPMATMDSSNNGGANHAKIMQYRQAGLFDSATVYFGPLKVGTTRASVRG